MNIIGIFAELTPEQREKFNAIKDSAELGEFLKETGLELTDEEKAQIMEYIATGKLPLSDEELDNVAGGGCGSKKKKTAEDWRKEAEKDNRRLYFPYRHACGAQDNGTYSIYARIRIYNDRVGGSYIYRDLKCYDCGWTDKPKNGISISKRTKK